MGSTSAPIRFRVLRFIGTMWRRRRGPGAPRRAWGPSDPSAPRSEVETEEQGQDGGEAEAPGPIHPGASGVTRGGSPSRCAWEPVERDAAPGRGRRPGTDLVSPVRGSLRHASFPLSATSSLGTRRGAVVAQRRGQPIGILSGGGPEVVIPALGSVRALPRDPLHRVADPLDRTLRVAHRVLGAVPGVVDRFLGSVDRSLGRLLHGLRRGLDGLRGRVLRSIERRVGGADRVVAGLRRGRPREPEGRSQEDQGRPYPGAPVALLHRDGQGSAVCRSMRFHDPLCGVRSREPLRNQVRRRSPLA